MFSYIIFIVVYLDVVCTLNRYKKNFHRKKKTSSRNKLIVS